MNKGTFYNLRLLKIVGGVGIAVLLAFCFSFLELNPSYYVLTWAVSTLILETAIWGKLKLDKTKFAPDKKNRVSYEEMMKHFLTMRKAKFAIIFVSLAGMGVGFSFDAAYMVLATVWTIYVYALKTPETSAFFEKCRSEAPAFFEKCRPLSTEELKKSDMNECNPGSLAYILRRSRER